jgi:hypothetical protein
MVSPPSPSVIRQVTLTLRSRTDSINKPPKTQHNNTECLNPYVSTQRQILQVRPLYFLQINARVRKLPKWRTVLRLYWGSSSCLLTAVCGPKGATRDHNIRHVLFSAGFIENILQLGSL